MFEVIISHKSMRHKWILVKNDKTFWSGTYSDAIQEVRRHAKSADCVLIYTIQKVTADSVLKRYYLKALIRN